MRLVFKGMLLAVAALALSGVAAAAASAETHEWLLNGNPVTTSTPVTDSATQFTVRRQEKGGGEEETVTCALSGKGTVSAKGVGAITGWGLTSCERHGTAGLTCEAGTLSGPTALNLPWKTQILNTEGIGVPVYNEVHAEKGVAFTWQCKIKNIIGTFLYKVTCVGPDQRNELKHELGQVGERWAFIPSPEMSCERSLGSEKLETGAAIVVSATHLKAEKGELSFK